MTALNLFYNLIANLAGPLLALAATIGGRFGGPWRERLGLTFFPRRIFGRPRLWFHGSSVGEIQSAAAVIAALQKQCPEAEIYLSATTPAGLNTAAKILTPPKKNRIIAAPLDFWGAPSRVLTRLAPDVLVIMETELWPNFLTAAAASGTKIILAAARLTPISFKRYQLIQKFMAGLLAKFQLIAPASEAERDFFAALGAAPDRLKILGNPKFDLLLATAENSDFKASVKIYQQKLWGEAPTAPLLVAGSTHPGEEDLIAAAFIYLKKSRPDLRLLLAPRHLGRIQSILASLKKLGLRCALAGTELNQPLFPEMEVVILDSLGQLQTFYALASIVLIGGSLKPGLSGHNPLEPAAVKKPILFGPHMKSFALEAAGLTSCGGAIQTSQRTLAQDFDQWLRQPDAAEKAGRAAHAFLTARKPVAPSLAKAILQILQV
ncbi:MAG: hypothetical protein AMR96_00590 [Candidatus Adiutrix intracellularis]|nr:MAG: hypothetical protein AMR96_00590 [Candidatus Adiutrix intracellularis]